MADGKAGGAAAAVMDELLALGFSERELAERHGVGEADYRAGLTYAKAAENSGTVYEAELPAGAVLRLEGGRMCVLMDAAWVWTDNPATVLEVMAEPGADWPRTVALRPSPRPPVAHRGVVMAYVPRGD